MFGLVTRKRAIKVAEISFFYGMRVGLLAAGIAFLFAAGFKHGNKE